MFTDNDLKAAIEQGIFDKKNNTPANPARVIRFFEQWAKERERALRHAAAEIALTSETKDEAHQKIMNLEI